MKKQLQEKVLLKIGNEQKLTGKEENCLPLLEREGFIERSKDKLKLTNSGKIITVMGLNSFRKNEEIDQEFSDFSTQSIERNKLLLLISFAFFLLVLLTFFWMYVENLFNV